MGRKVTISQFLTEEEVQRAMDMHKQTRDSPTTLHRKLVDEIIKPNIRRINADLGQANDPAYLGYMLEYALDRSTR